MECHSVLAKALGARHDSPHRFQGGMRVLGHLIPRSLQTGNGRGAQGRNDRNQC